MLTALPVLTALLLSTSDARHEPPRIPDQVQYSQPFVWPHLPEMPALEDIPRTLPGKAVLLWVEPALLREAIAPLLRTRPGSALATQLWDSLAPAASVPPAAERLD